jgi:hypothetical protein
LVSAGNVRAGFGEGLLLGSRNPDATPLAAGTREGDLRVSPSLSLWERIRGAAASFKIRLNRRADDHTELFIGGLGWDRYETSSKARQPEGWLTISFTKGRWWLGSLAGFPLARPIGQDQANLPPPRAWSLAVKRTMSDLKSDSSPGGRAGLSLEIARLGPDLFFVAGGSGRSRRSGRWTCRLFRQPAPRGFGGSASGLEWVTRTIQGASCHLAGRLKRINTCVYLYSARSGSGKETTHYRRLAGSVSWRPPGRKHRLKGGVSFYIKRRAKANLSTLLPDLRISEWGEYRIGLSWEYSPNQFINNKIRIDSRLDEGFRRAGLVAGVFSRLCLGGGEAVLSVTNYSLETGRSGFLVRPGIGSFEYLSVVYGDGSDISLRIRYEIRPSLIITGFYGQPWNKEPRMYVSGCWKGG